jgi:hypothetical protein
MLGTGVNEPFPDQVVNTIAELGPVNDTSADGSSVSFTSGHTYYWVAIGANDSNFDAASAYSIGELRSFTAL